MQYKEIEGPVKCFMASGESVKDLLEWQEFIAPKLAQWIWCCISGFTAVYSERRPVIGPVMIETAKSYYD